MGLTNPGTPFDKDGWADVIADIRRLQLAAEGGANDLNNASNPVDQVPNQVQMIEVTVCDNGVLKTMKIMATQPT